MSKEEIKQFAEEYPIVVLLGGLLIGLVIDKITEILTPLNRDK